MKKIIFLAALLTAGESLSQTQSTFGTPAFFGTNRLAFTNAYGFSNDFSNMQVADAGKVLLSLEGNIEQALPALFILTSAQPLNILSNASFRAAAGVRASPLPPATATASPRGVRPSSLSSEPPMLGVVLGTNIFAMDPQTFQELLALQNSLQQAVPILQQLNGLATNPNATNAFSFTNHFVFITNTTALPMTNRFLMPLTNGFGPGQ